MALSNIFREPRREITETVVGIGMFGVLALADFGFAEWFLSVMPPYRSNEADFVWFLSLSLGAIAGFLLVGALVGVHAMGEALCNRLETAGIRLRPRR